MKKVTFLEHIQLCEPLGCKCKPLLPSEPFFQDTCKGQDESIELEARYPVPDTGEPLRALWKWPDENEPDQEEELMSEMQLPGGAG